MLACDGGAQAACPSSALDLDSVSLSNTYKFFLQDTPYLTSGEQIATHLPIAFTYEVDHFCFGDILLPLTDPNDFPRNQVGVLINNVAEKKTVGLRIQVEDEKITSALFDMLKQKYGNPKLLTPAPTHNSDGSQLGYAAYWWDRDEPIIIVHEYGHDAATDSGTRGTTYYRLINRQVRDSDDREVINRLRDTYTQ